MCQVELADRTWYHKPQLVWHNLLSQAGSGAGKYFNTRLLALVGAGYVTAYQQLQLIAELILGNSLVKQSRAY
jgi:hypothetical protein